MYSSNNLSGHILFYVKYNTSTELVSNKFQELLKASQSRDQGVGKVQVNDLKSNLVELKLIMSAKSASEFSRLRKEVLEKLLGYMQTQHPERLP